MKFVQRFQQLMNNKVLKLMFVLLLLFSRQSFAADTTVHMTFTNFVQTSHNTFEYDAMLTNTGTNPVPLVGYSWGLNVTPGLANGGVLTHSFVSRDTILSSLPGVSCTYTAVNFQLRATTASASPPLAVYLAPGAIVRMATMRVKTTATCFINLFNPFNPTPPATPVQLSFAINSTQCQINLYSPASGLIYTINSIANTPASLSIQGMTASMNPDPYGLNPFLLTHPGSVSSATFCDSYTWPVSGLTYTASGIYAHTYVIAPVCDSIVVLNLTISTTSNVQQTLSACQSLTFNGITYTNTGNYTQHYTNMAGCDSNFLLNLTIVDTLFTILNVSTCDSLPYNGNVYTSSGTYTDTLTGMGGCDSIIILNLTLNNSSASITTQTACNSYLWGLQTYTLSGIYTQTFNTVAGCDSVMVLNLTVNYGPQRTINQTACKSYSFNGITYSSSGTYSVSKFNPFGCDSLITLHLIIHPEYSFSNNVTSCGSYEVNGQTYTASGVYTLTYLTSTGCDSILKLNLTILPASNQVLNQVSCNYFTLNGITYSTSGTYTQNYVDVSGCDSIITLKLVISPNTFKTQEVSQCYGVPYRINNHTYTSSGQYLDTLKNSFGCDSIVSTELFIDETPEGAGYIANAFSPNGDGLNDCFGVSYWRDVKEFQLIIANRWGNIVFTTRSIDDCWYGDYNNTPAAQDTYYYYLKAKTKCGERVYKGDILLIR